MKKEEDEASINMLLHQLSHLSEYQIIRRTEELGLRLGQAGILLMLNFEGRLSQRELSDKIGITPPSTTVALRKLEQMGYVVREPDENDQRIIRIRLSDDGRTCARQLQQIIGELEEITFQGISTEERLLLRRLLLAMRDNLMKSRELKGVDLRSVMEKTCPPIRPEKHPSGLSGKCPEVNRRK